MQLARVLGTCVATRKVESLRGLRLLILQPLTFDLEPRGPHVIAADVVRAGRGELVFFVRGREAANSLPQPFCPIDAACVGIVDELGMVALTGATDNASREAAGRPVAAVRAQDAAAAGTPQAAALVWRVRQGGEMP